MIIQEQDWGIFNMKKVMTIGLGLFVCLSAFAKIDYYIDPEILKYETLRAEKLAELHKEYGCKKEKGYACFEKSSDELDMEYPARGRAYAKMHYSKFSEKQAYEKLAELAILYEKLPLKVAGKPPLGVIKKSRIESEAWFIVDDLLKIEQKRSSDLLVKYNSTKLKSPFLDKKLNILTPLAK